MKIGRTGSTDRLIVRLDERGLYLSVRVAKTRGFRLSFGPGYINRLELR